MTTGYEKQKPWKIQFIVVLQKVLHIYKKELWMPKNNLVIIITTLIFGYSSNTLSSEVWLNTHLASYHHQAQYEYNENNLGLGISYPLSPEFDLVTGFYENSYNKTSYYAGYRRHTADNYGFSVGISAVVVTGYEDTRYTSASAIVMFLPNLTYSLKNFRVELGIIPAFSKRDYTAVTTFTIGTKF